MPMPSFSLLDERRPTMSVLFGCERVLGGDLKVHEVEAFRDVGFLLNSLYSGFFLRSVSTLSLMMVDMSTSPRYLSGVRFAEMMPGGWTGSYASVASFPAYFYRQDKDELIDVQE